MTKKLIFFSIVFVFFISCTDKDRKNQEKLVEEIKIEIPDFNEDSAYKYVYKVDKLVTGDYLYKPVNNIELGCAYFSKIRYYYFENIENDELAYICSIPAYNTGIGNVSKTLCGKPYTNPAAKVASSMTPDELYQKLTSDLKYEEARNYLKKVWKYKEKYKG